MTQEQTQEQRLMELVTRLMTTHYPVASLLSQASGALQAGQQDVALEDVLRALELLVSGE